MTNKKKTSLKCLSKNQKCKCGKKGGGLSNLLLPMGLIVAREYAPQIIRSLKKRLTKKRGKKRGKKRSRTIRRRRSSGRSKERKTLRGGKFSTCSSCQTGGSKTLGGGKFSSCSSCQTGGRKRTRKKTRKKSRGIIAALNRKKSSNKKPKDPCCKKRCGCGPGRGAYGLKGPKGECYDNLSYCCEVDRACKNKQTGGFMRGATRNFCQIKN